MNNIFQTMGGDPRNFNKLNLYKLPSPCFVIDKRALIDNLKVLYNLKSQTGVKILIALKAFSTPYFGPLISEYLDGCCSSGLYETKLAKKYFKGEKKLPKRSVFITIDDEIPPHLVFTLGKNILFLRTVFGMNDKRNLS